MNHGAAAERRRPIPTLRWVLSFVLPQRWRLAVFFVCGIVMAGTQLVVPMVLQFLADRIIPSGNDRLMLYGLIGVAIAVCVSFFVNAGYQLLRIIMQERAAHDIHQTIFSKVRQLGVAHYERTPIGETIAYFSTEVPAVQEVYQKHLPNLIQSGTLFVLTWLLSCLVSVELSLIIVPFLFLYVAGGNAIAKKAGKYSQESQRLRVHYNRQIFDGISSASELKAYAAGKWKSAEILNAHRAYQRVFQKEYALHMLSGVVRSLTIGMGTVATVVYGIDAVNRHEMTIGQFTSFSFYYFMLMNITLQIVSTINEQRIAMRRAERLQSLMRLEPAVKEPENPVVLPKVRGEILFDRVSFHYPEQPDVLKAISFRVRPGEKVALVGKSGSGKSTVLKLIGRFHDPASGSIAIDGVPIQRMSLSQLHREVGYVFQETYLFGGSIKDNLRFGNPDATDGEIMEAAMLANVHDFVSELPDRYDTIAGEKGVKLSGGQKQRIAIARMLLYGPSIILLDEATSALDQKNEHDVQRALAQRFKEHTIIAVAHRLSTIRYYDRIIVMEDGRIVESGTYDELMNGDTVFKRLQAGGILSESE